jgi:hypothetical protein
MNRSYIFGPKPAIPMPSIKDCRQAGHYLSGFHAVFKGESRMTTVPPSPLPARRAPLAPNCLPAAEKPNLPQSSPITPKPPAAANSRPLVFPHHATHLPSRIPTQA